jgi:hypothetical protein
LFGRLQAVFSFIFSEALIFIERNDLVLGVITWVLRAWFQTFGVLKFLRAYEMGTLVPACNDT